MSMERVFAATREMPAEYEPGNPSTCAECGAEWDYDDESREFVEMDGAIYCRENCLDAHRNAEYRASLSGVIALVRKALQETERLQREFGQGDDPDDPAGAIDDAISAVWRFKKGIRHGNR